MKQYNIYKTLKDEWFTLPDLLEYLKSKKYAAVRQTIIVWEKEGIIPQPKRVLFKGSSWRVYKKDKSDFKEIINLLSKKTQNMVMVRK